MTLSSLDSSTMENSGILRDIAELDIKAPISVTICFEEDIDETPIKTEIETDECQKKTQEDNSAFVPILEPKKENRDEEQYIEQQNFQKAHQPENLENKLAYEDSTRKRKIGEVELSQIKRTKCRSDTMTKNDGNQVFSHFFTNNVFDNISRTTSNLPSKKFTDENSAVTPVDNGLTDTQISADESKNPVDLNGLQQNELDSINAYITNCLANVSEHMRCIMEAHDLHCNLKISKEAFKQVKMKLFYLSYKTLDTIFLPEENNNEFIQTFLKDTVERARKPRVGRYSYCVHPYHDYENLLKNMLTWTKQYKQNISRAAHSSTNLKETSVPPSAAESSSKNRIEHNNYPVQDTTTSSIQNYKTGCAQGSATELDKVCIFSSGPPGREFSLNIDPVKYSQITAQSWSTEAKLAQKQTNANPLNMLNKNSIKSIIKDASQEHNIKHNQFLETQARAPHVSNLAANVIQQSNIATGNIPNHSIAQQTKTRTPTLQKQLGKQQEPMLFGPLQYLQRQGAAFPAPPPYEYSHRHISPQYDQQRHVHVPLGHQQQAQSHYSQAQFKQTQQMQQHVKYLQSRLRQNQRTSAQYGHSEHAYAQFGQAQQVLQQHGHSNLQMQWNQSQQLDLQFKQSHVEQAQQGPQVHPTDRYPSLAELLSKAPTLLPSQPLINGQPQNVLRQHNRPQYGQKQLQNSQSLQFQPQNHQAEWHNEVNSQVPPQTQKGSPRSASTDSGFISPLNFNVSTEQTIPKVPQEPEPAMPLITHVTSLSDKVAFVELGNCVVCKKSTKQMCMGCMKIYYCTYQCQSQDWTTHSAYCTQQNTSSGGARLS